jgi:hypothetical protein
VGSGGKNIPAAGARNAPGEAVAEAVETAACSRTPLRSTLVATIYFPFGDIEKIKDDLTQSIFLGVRLLAAILENDNRRKR